MEEIARALYFNIIQPLLMAGGVISTNWIANKLFGFDIFEFLVAVVKEIKAVLNRDRNVKSLNAIIMIFTFFALLVFGLAFGPQPESAAFAFGKGAMWCALYLLAIVFCVHLVRSEPD